MSDVIRKPLPKRNNVKKGVTIGVLASAFILAGFLGSYAYFLNSGGTKENEKVSVETGNLSLIFSDGNEGFDKTLNFGESAEKTFTLENNGSLDVSAKIRWKDLINTYTLGSLTYTLSYSESEDGIYTEIVNSKDVPTSPIETNKSLASNINMPSKTKYYFKLKITLNYLKTIDQTNDINAYLSTKFDIVEYTGNDIEDLEGTDRTLAVLGVTVNEGNPNFAEPATTDEGVYAMEDDYGTSYYYRGAVENNYVKFGTWKEVANAGKPMYWRIIRVNGDGSLRIQYDGTSAHTNGESNTDRLAITNQVYHAQSSDAKYVGYMYGPAGTTASTSKEQAQTNTEDSDIKKAIESWYKTNLSDMDSNISDNIFCNDRSTGSTPKEWWTSEGTEIGYGTNLTAYGAFNRNLTTSGNWKSEGVNPTLKCKNKNDAFTKSDTTNGNGKLSQKVGMITIDEVDIAGGENTLNNTSYYLYKGSLYWSLSPSIFRGSGASMFNVAGNGNLNYYHVHIAMGVAPVINLSAEYVKTMKGDGSMNNPFRSADEA